MSTSEGHEFEVQAAEALYEAGFHKKRFDQLEIPPIEEAEVFGATAKLVVFGDSHEAERIHLSTVPYSTRITDRSQLIRAAAQHAVLGPDTALVVAQLYDPTDQKFSAIERAHISSGMFRPLANRLAGVVRYVGVRDHQKLDLSGFSMGADVATEVAFNAVMSERTFDFPTIDRLGVFEPARVMKRGAIGVAMAFASSGGDLFKNVLDSHSPALLEARGIDPDEIDSGVAEKKHEKAVNRGVVDWNLADIRGNVALMRGFGTDVTLAQLSVLQGKESAPSTVVVRLEDSRVCPEKAFGSTGISPIVEPGDHSSADNVLRAASFALRTASLGRRT